MASTKGGGMLILEISDPSAARSIWLVEQNPRFGPRDRC